MSSGGLDATEIGTTVVARRTLAGESVSDTVVGETHWSVETSDGQVRLARDAAEGTDAAPRRWRLGRRARYLMVIDLLCAGGAVALAYDIRPGGRTEVLMASILPFVWVGVIAGNRGYERRFLGVGNGEFGRLFCAFLQLTAVTSFGTYAVGKQGARDLILIALPLALASGYVVRATARRALRRARALGRCTTRVLAIGSEVAISNFSDQLSGDRSAGLQVVGACAPATGPHPVRASTELGDRDIPLLGDVDSVLESARACRAQTVAVLSRDMPADKLRWISWQLEGAGIDMVVVPGLIEVAGRRVHLQPVAGLSLLHVDEPTFSGFRRVIKAGLDRFVAGIAIITLSPVLLALAVLVRLTSSGPAYFVQTRVGRNGRTFRMVKFRSMYRGSERKVSELLTQNEAADGLLFKIREDPRVTPIGRFLRRFSLDELPQLFNVLTGSMSLVGPRPALPREVARYDPDMQRRLLVRPGITGLWQVSGRSDLTWDESVRLDLRYVENWSLTLDLLVLLKTTRVVFTGAGAY
jgi:exopolysaccharide biosynthesis polyprenyl glycosylphosphotransferase